MAMRHAIGLTACIAALALAAPAVADVKDGVDAWSRGDYAAAVNEWRAPAEAGDADAMFNLGQAYRLGLGVDTDETRAEYYYARAAEAGHIRAADTYGLILFQSGRTQAAMPFIEQAARRGDPRSQYLLGIAHFNGDIIRKDWVRAYALLTLANSQGLPQAASAMAQMDEHIPMAQRQQAAGLAVEMRQETEAVRNAELAAFDLAAVGGDAVPPPRVAGGPLPTASPRVPQPVAAAVIEPSLAAANDALLAEAQEAVRQAALATGTEDPGEAGADFARTPGAAPPRVAAAPPPAPAPVTRQPAPPPPPAATAATGPWKLQLGAFGVKGNAEKLWSQLSSRPELRGKTRLLVPAGRLTKLLAGGFASRADANAACARLQSAGQACIVTQ